MSVHYKSECHSQSASILFDPRLRASEFIKVYRSSGRTQGRPGPRTFSGKKQEREEHPGRHLAVSSLLFRAKLVLEPVLEQ